MRRKKSTEKNLLKFLKKDKIRKIEEVVREIVLLLFLVIGNVFPITKKEVAHKFYFIKFGA